MPALAVVRRSLALLTAGAVLALAGCSADGGGAGDRAAGRIGTVEATDGPGSAAGAVAIADRKPGDDLTVQEFADLCRAALEQATTTHVTISSTGSSGVSAEGDIDYGEDPVRAALTATVPQMGGEVEVRLIDNVLYLRMPMLSAKFVKVDLEGPGGGLRDMLTGPLDPTAVLGLLDNAARATYVGSEDRSGEQLDHYTVEVDPGALAEAVPQAPGLAGAGAVSLDVWFDDTGLLRNFAVDLGASSGTLEIEFSEWGQDVSIQAPPSDDVTTMPGLPS